MPSLNPPSPQMPFDPPAAVRVDAGTPPAPPGKPSAAFVGVSWLALLAGAVAFLIGLYNADLAMASKGFYLTLLLYGLFSAVAVQKAVRDKLEGVPVSPLFLGLSWASVAAVLVLLSTGLWNADLLRSEKGFYAMSFALSMFAAVAVQKNVRDASAADALAKTTEDSGALTARPKTGGARVRAGESRPD